MLARSLAYRFPEDAEALETYASRLSKHLQHTYYACEHVLQQPYEPDLLLVSGVRGDQASMLAKALQEVDDIPAEVWRVTAGAYKADQTRLPAPDLARYAVAFGMALRGLHRRACGVNLRRERFALHKDLEELRGRFIVLGILAMGVIGLGIGESLSQHVLQSPALCSIAGRDHARFSGNSARDAHGPADRATTRKNS